MSVARKLYSKAETIRIAPTQLEHAQQLEELQRLAFPSIADNERFKKEHYAKHLQIFPEGQFVALDGNRVVGMTSSIRQDIDFNHAHQSYLEMIAGGFLTNHQPDGKWLYGVDLGVHPDYRMHGIGRRLYDARNALVRKLNLKGQCSVGVISGYGKFKNQMSAEEYFEKLKSGAIVDPTVSMQMRVGFEPIALVPNYVNDPLCDNYGVLIVLKPY